MDIVTKSFKEFSELFTSSSFHMRKNVSIMKTGIDHWSMNFCIINGDLEQADIDFIKNKFDVPGILLSAYQSDDRLWSIESLKPGEEFPFMKREEVPDFYKAPFYDDIEVLSVSEYPMIFSDFISMFCQIRSLDEETVMNKINIDKLKNNHHFFVAYMSDNPVGIFHAISDNEDAFIIESSVKENYRNTGVLNVMAKKAKEYALSRDLYNFYAIPTSEFSVKVMKEMGYYLIGTYHIWQNTK